MKQNCSNLKIIIFAAVFCIFLGFAPAFAQDEDYYEVEVLKVELESEPVAPKDELQNMQSKLSELEYYYSELKAQEVKALKGLPAAMKNKKFKSSSEKILYYEKLSNEYADKLANEQLNKNDIKISQNLMTLSDLYKTEESIKSLKKEIKKNKQIQNNK